MCNCVHSGCGHACACGDCYLSIALLPRRYRCSTSKTLETPACGAGTSGISGLEKMSGGRISPSPPRQFHPTDAGSFGCPMGKSVRLLLRRRRRCALPGTHNTLVGIGKTQVRWLSSELVNAHSGVPPDYHADHPRIPCACLQIRVMARLSGAKRTPQVRWRRVPRDATRVRTVLPSTFTWEVPTAQARHATSTTGTWKRLLCPTLIALLAPRRLCRRLPAPHRG